MSSLGIDHLNAGGKHIITTFQTVPRQGEIKLQSVKLARNFLRSLHSRHRRGAPNPQSPSCACRYLPRIPGLGVRLPKRPVASGEAPEPGSETHSQVLPVFYFDRIRVGRLHLHFHVSHDSPVLGPSVGEARGRHTASRETEEPGNKGKTVPGLGKGPFLSCRSRSLLVLSA